MKRIITMLTILFISAQVFAQGHGVCGNMPSDQAMSTLMASKAMLKKSNIGQTEDIKYIPVKFHLIANTEGIGAVKEIDVLKQLAVLNSDYANTDFRFYIKNGEMNHYSSTYIYETARTSNLAKNQMNALRDVNAVDVFVVNFIGSGSGGLGTVLGYYLGPYASSTNDWIVMLKQEAQLESNTLSHELGHFFSLAHTFYGWEGEPFGPTSAGWPTAPATSPNGTTLTERQDGSNCDVAADRVCDTPPGYNFGLITNGCNYTGGAKDPLGVVVDPMENNQMGYFSGCYPYIFTPGQIALMNADYEKSSRNYLKSSYVPNMTQPTEKPIQNTPQDDANAGGNVGVILDWTTVADADYYLVELSRTSSFSQLNQTFVVSESSIELPTLEAGKSYFWKVTPFTEGGTDVTGLTSTSRKFKASPLATSNIDEINAWDIMPNPTTAEIRFAIELDKSIDISAQLISTNGQVLQTQQFNVVAGEQVLRMPQLELSNGTYFLRLTSKNGVETRRVFVQK